MLQHFLCDLGRVFEQVFGDPALFGEADVVAAFWGVVARGESMGVRVGMGVLWNWWFLVVLLEPLLVLLGLFY